MTRSIILTAAIILAATPATRAGLILEYIQVASITAGPSAGPALSGPLVMDATGQVAPATVFLQVALRDTLGAGPNFGQPGTVAWQTNGGLAGPGSLGLGAFFIRFDGIPGIAINPQPQTASNARLVDPVNYGTVTSQPAPGGGTRIGGLLNFGSEPGAVPDPVTHRIGLFNLRINAVANGAGIFRLRDPNPAPTSTDTALLQDADIGGVPEPGTLIPIDDFIFGPSFTNTYDLPVVVIPEPSALTLVGLAATTWLRRAVPCRWLRALEPRSRGLPAERSSARR